MDFDSLVQRHDQLMRNTDMKIVRSFIDRVNWDAPMLCIRGARGVGKSTLIRQYIKRSFPAGSRKALYCSLDWVYFTLNSILDTAEIFYARGGRLLVLDEVHKYPNWSREVKEVAEVYPDLQIVLSGSSLLNILNGDADLSRRCVGYDMPGLSFREYLRFYHDIEVPSFTLEEILSNPFDVTSKILDRCRPLEYFRDYLAHGYYPFYRRNAQDYYALLEQTVNHVIDVELPQLRGVNPANCRKIKALLTVLAQQVPFEVEITKLAALLELQRVTVLEYLNHLNQASLIQLLYSDIFSVKKMQKPDKIYVDNPNLLYALSTSEVLIGTAREGFVVNQLSVAHKVEYGRSEGDFKVDGRWLFEVGGRRKGFKQIADIPDSFVLADDLELPVGNKLPLYLFGFLY